MSDAVLLIPGFLGFGTFGEGTQTEIRYFDHVIDVLVRHRPELAGWIQALEPPPTGRLASRVAYLHGAVVDALERGIDGNPARRPTRIHLVGHSTGGVDARLMTNVDFVWEGAPTAAARRAILDRVGAVVTVSAPLHGSPIADAFRGVFRPLLPAFYLLSIIASVRSKVGAKADVIPIRDVVREVLSLAPLSDQRTAQILVTLDHQTRADIGRFLGRISADGSLIDDLRPIRMKALNATVNGGDSPRLRHVVTVAPPPAFDLDDLGENAPYALLYRMVYKATASGAVAPVAFPQGAWLAPEGSSLTGEALANDGIVPSRSQSVDGGAESMLVGDHLDVIGHFRSTEFDGLPLISSGSGFDDGRFDRLWGRVAAITSGLSAG